MVQYLGHVLLLLGQPYESHRVGVYVAGVFGYSRLASFGHGIPVF